MREMRVYVVSWIFKFEVREGEEGSHSAPS